MSATDIATDSYEPSSHAQESSIQSSLIDSCLLLEISGPNKELTPIGYEFSLSPFIKNEIQAHLIRNYDINHYILEKEAFSLQGNKNGVNLLLKAINERCNDI